MIRTLLYFSKGSIISFFNNYPYDTEQFAGKYWAHLVSDDKLYLLYTARNREYYPPEKQALAVSTDGIHFDKMYGGFPVLVDTQVGKHFRDPKLYGQSGNFWMLIGSGDEKHGKLLKYTSQDLIHWKFCSIFAKDDGTLGGVWECPDYFRLHNTDYLFISVPNYKQIGSVSFYTKGKVNTSSNNFTIGRPYSIDDGQDFYAPTTYRMEDGRLMMIGWMDRWYGETPTRKLGWVGSLSFPREVRQVLDGLLEFMPAREIAKLREGMKSIHNLFASNTLDPWQTWKATQFELSFTIDLAKSNVSTFSLQFRASDNFLEYSEIIFDLVKMVVRVNLEQSGAVKKIPFNITLKRECTSTLDVTLLVDNSSMELFLQQGSTTISNRMYPKETSQNIRFFCGEGLFFKNIFFAKLKNAKIDFSNL